MLAPGVAHIHTTRAAELSELSQRVVRTEARVVFPTYIPLICAISARTLERLDGLTKPRRRILRSLGNCTCPPIPPRDFPMLRVLAASALFCEPLARRHDIRTVPQNDWQKCDYSDNQLHRIVRKVYPGRLIWRRTFDRFCYIVE